MLSAFEELATAKPFPLPSGSGKLRSPAKTISECSSNAKRGGHIRHEDPKIAFFQIAKRRKEPRRIGILMGKTSYGTTREGREPQSYVADLLWFRESRNLHPNPIVLFPKKKRKHRRIVPMSRPGGVGKQLSGFGKANPSCDCF
jgi:hypothetical protein